MQEIDRLMQSVTSWQDSQDGKLAATVYDARNNIEDLQQTAIKTPAMLSEYKADIREMIKALQVIEGKVLSNG